MGFPLVYVEMEQVGIRFLMMVLYRYSKQRFQLLNIKVFKTTFAFSFLPSHHFIFIVHYTASSIMTVISIQPLCKTMVYKRTSSHGLWFWFSG